jgi:uncharacterized protein (TIGR02301 family)
MGQPERQLLWLAVAAALSFAPMATAYPSPAKAQFFNWFSSPEPPKPHVRVKPPGDDLPPIVPKESTAPPPPDDRPYDNKLMRLAEILGAVHYLRELCGANEGQLWRDQMREILKNEGTTAVRRAKLVNSFNDGYRGYRRTYRSCTQSATLATARFSTEGAQIAASLAQGSAFASKGSSEPKPDAANPGDKKEGAVPQAGKQGTAPDGTPTGSVDQGTQPNANASASVQPDAGQSTADAKPADTGQRHGKHRKAAAPEATATPADATPADTVPDGPDGGF